MNKSQYQKRTERLNPGIRQEEVERKWRKYLKEKEETERYQMVSEAENTPAVQASGAGGGNAEEITPINTDFISVWRTTSPSESITLPLISTGTYDFFVDWGDNTSDTITLYSDPKRIHTYGATGDHVVTIRGTIEGFNFNDVPASALKIREVTQWGDLRLVDGGSYFKSCSNLGLVNVTDVLDLTGLTNLSYMFYECARLTTVGRMNEWDVGQIQNFSSMFSRATNFNQPIYSWQTGSATDMSFMFNQTFEFNQSLLFWDVSNVQNMFGMFATAVKFDQPLSLWDTGNVNNMSSMFFSAVSFNRPINSWDVRNVNDMPQMFAGAANFNQPLGLWDTLSVTNMAAMFSTSSFNQPIGSWDVGNVQNMSYMFDQNTEFNQPLNSWNTVSLQDASYMFRNATAFDQPLNSWLTGNVNFMSSMFQNATAFNQNIGSWNIENIFPITGLSAFMDGKTPADYSTANYDNLLIGWASQLGLPSNVNADFGTIQYTARASDERDFLINDYLWFISDGGIV
jgi:hypothetical protein